ncbi:protein phosphatase CheZ [Pseudomonadota bacterium]
MTDNICNDASLENAKKLVEYIEKGDDVSTVQLIEELSAMRESDLFMELGKLTRDLHDTISGFQLDSKIFDMTSKDIPDAKERLNHVITMTEEAADKTLTLVESSLPIADDLQTRSAELQEKWNRFKSRDMDVNEFRALSDDIDDFFVLLNGKTPALQSNLSEILMAQGFQDLTGQIIRRVIMLVQEVEDSLVDLVRITGEKMAQKPAQEEPKAPEGPDITAVGPAVPGVDKGDIVSGQDDVDDLLSSLGF